MVGLALFTREITIIYRNMMRFPRMPIDHERNDKLSSEYIYNIFATLPCIELALGPAVYPQRCLLHRDSEQTAIPNLIYDLENKLEGTTMSSFRDFAKVVEKFEN